jgi:hypothetical protein
LCSGSFTALPSRGRRPSRPYRHQWRSCTCHEAHATTPDPSARAAHDPRLRRSPRRRPRAISLIPKPTFGDLFAMASQDCAGARAARSTGYAPRSGRGAVCKDRPPPAGEGGTPVPVVQHHPHQGVNHLEPRIRRWSDAGALPRHLPLAAVPVEAAGRVLWLPNPEDTLTDIRWRIVATTLPSPPASIRPTSYPFGPLRQRRHRSHPCSARASRLTALICWPMPRWTAPSLRWP